MRNVAYVTRGSCCRRANVACVTRGQLLPPISGGSTSRRLLALGNNQRHATTTPTNAPVKLPWGLTRRYERRLPASKLPDAPDFVTLGVLNRPPWQRNPDAQGSRAYVDALATPRDAHILTLACEATMLSNGVETLEPPPRAAPKSSDEKNDGGNAQQLGLSSSELTRVGRKRGVLSGLLPSQTNAKSKATKGDRPKMTIIDLTKDGAAAVESGGEMGNTKEPTPKAIALFLDGAKEVFISLFRNGLPGVHSHYAYTRERLVADAAAASAAAKDRSPPSVNSSAGEAFLPEEARDVLHDSIIEALQKARAAVEGAAAVEVSAAATSAAAHSAAIASSPPPTASYTAGDGTAAASSSAEASAAVPVEDLTLATLRASPPSVPPVRIKSVLDAKIVDTYAVWNGSLRESDFEDDAAWARERGHSIAIITKPDRMSALERLAAQFAHFYQLQTPRSVLVQATVAFMCSEDGATAPAAASSTASAPAGDGICGSTATSSATPTAGPRTSVHTLTFETLLEDDLDAMPLIAPLLRAAPILRHLREPRLRPVYGWRVIDIDGHFSPVGGSTVPSALSTTIPSYGLTFSGDLLSRALGMASKQTHGEIEGEMARMREEGPLYGVLSSEVAAAAKALTSAIDAVWAAGAGGRAALGDDQWSGGDRSLAHVFSSCLCLLTELERISGELAAAATRPPWMGRVEQEQAWEKAVDEGGMWQAPPSPSKAAAAAAAAIKEQVLRSLAEADGDDEEEAKEKGDGQQDSAAGAKSASDASASAASVNEDTSKASGGGNKKDSGSDSTTWRNVATTISGVDVSGLYEEVPAVDVIPRFDRRDVIARTVTALRAAQGDHLAVPDRLAMRLYALGRERVESANGELTARMMDSDMTFNMVRSMGMFGVRQLAAALQPYDGSDDEAEFSEPLQALVTSAREVEGKGNGLTSIADAVTYVRMKSFAGLAGSDSSSSNGSRDEADSDSDDEGAKEEAEKQVVRRRTEAQSLGVVSHRPERKGAQGRQAVGGGGAYAAYFKGLYAYMDGWHDVMEDVQAIALRMRAKGLLRDAKLSSFDNNGGGDGDNSSGSRPKGSGGGNNDGRWGQGDVGSGSSAGRRSRESRRSRPS